MAYPPYSKLVEVFAASEATPEARVSKLRQVPFDQILEAHGKVATFGVINLTVEEGPNAIWTESAIKTFKEGRWDEWVESVIIGSNEDEGSFFAFPLGVSSHADSWRCAIDTDASLAYSSGFS
jgi:carboxylesterase type B